MDRKNNILLAWISRHVGIIGNEESELKAKETIKHNRCHRFRNICPPIYQLYQDFRNQINNIWMNGKISGTIVDKSYKQYYHGPNPTRCSKMTKTSE